MRSDAFLGNTNKRLVVAVAHALELSVGQGPSSIPLEEVLRKISAVVQKTTYKLYTIHELASMSLKQFDEAEAATPGLPPRICLRSTRQTNLVLKQHEVCLKLAGDRALTACPPDLAGLRVLAASLPPHQDSARTITPLSYLQRLHQSHLYRTFTHPRPERPQVQTIQPKAMRPNHAQHLRRGLHAQGLQQEGQGDVGPVDQDVEGCSRPVPFGRDPGEIQRQGVGRPG